LIDLSLNSFKEVEERFNFDRLRYCLSSLSFCDFLLLFLFRRVSAGCPINDRPDTFLNNVWFSHDELLSEFKRGKVGICVKNEGQVVPKSVLVQCHSNVLKVRQN